MKLAPSGGRAYCMFRSGFTEGGIRNAVTTLKPDWRYEIPAFTEPLNEPLRTTFGIYDIRDIRPGAMMVLKDEHRLVAETQQWESKGANFFLRVAISGATNETVAEELKSFLGSGHSTLMIEKIEAGIGAVYHFSERSGQYVCEHIQPPGAG
ncbi:MAG: hypothetical protein PHV13_00940 [Candidatus ainarchaeum sp.]|nr:hypothetical protein [Candidatus ainarchaeum sp.]